MWLYVVKASFRFLWLRAGFNAKFQFLWLHVGFNVENSLFQCLCVGFMAYPPFVHKLNVSFDDNFQFPWYAGFSANFKFLWLYIGLNAEVQFLWLHVSFTTKNQITCTCMLVIMLTSNAYGYMLISKLIPRFYSYNYVCLNADFQSLWPHIGFKYLWCR